MKNIIFITYLNLWSMDKGKGAPSFYKTLEAYIKSGWNVTLINPKYNIGITPNIMGLNTLTFKPVFYPMLKIKRISFFGRLLHSLQGDFQLYSLSKKALNDYEGNALIYSYEVHSVKAGNKLAKKYNVPHVTRFQGTVLFPIKNTLINRIKKYPHFNALSTSADITIMTDDGTKGDVVLKRLKNNSKIVKFWRNGVDLLKTNSLELQDIKDLKQKLNIYHSDKILLTVSRLASWKKVNRAIIALSEICKYRDDVKLVIVGDGDEKENLEKLAKSLSITDKVCFIGAVEQSEVQSYMEIADVFLSLYDLSNVGNPLLEAMSCGKPIVTLNVGDTDSIIKDDYNGILLDVADLDQLPSKIINLLENPSYANNLGSNAKEFAEKEFWSWDERMEAELEIVDKLYQKFYGDNNV